MTYCLGVYLRDGLVFASDSRTNAGVDHVATFRKMSIFEKAGDRVMYLLGAGNLATTQAVVNHLFRNLGDDTSQSNLYALDNMFDAAELIGDVMRSVTARHASHVKAANADPGADFLFGGQIKGGRHIQYPKDTPLTNLFLTIMGKMGDHQDRFGDSTGHLDLSHPA